MLMNWKSEEAYRTYQEWTVACLHVILWLAILTRDRKYTVYACLNKKVEHLNEHKLFFRELGT